MCHHNPRKPIQRQMARHLPMKHPLTKEKFPADPREIIYIEGVSSMDIEGEEVDEQDILKECICVQIHLYIYEHSVEIMPYQF